MQQTLLSFLLALCEFACIYRHMGLVSVYHGGRRFFAIFLFEHFLSSCSILAPYDCKVWEELEIGKLRERYLFFGCPTGWTWIL